MADIVCQIKIIEQLNLSIRKLREKIRNKEYERLPDSTKIKLINKNESNVIDYIKNPILIKNRNDYNSLSEKVL